MYEAGTLLDLADETSNMMLKKLMYAAYDEFLTEVSHKVIKNDKFIQ